MPTWQDALHRNAASAPIAVRLHEIASRTYPDASINVYGGAKSAIALFSIGGSTKVLCGIQPRPNDCLLFIHHVLPEDSTQLTLEGKGGTNRHIKIATLDAIEENENEIERLLRLARTRSGL
jgi:hypothetical protein